MSIPLTRAPLCRKECSMGEFLERAAAVGPPSGGSSLPKMNFRDIKGTIRFYQASGQDIPCSFIDSRYIAYGLMSLIL